VTEISVEIGGISGQGGSPRPRNGGGPPRYRQDRLPENISTRRLLTDDEMAQMRKHRPSGILKPVVELEMI
jgi:hypothetical protein